MEVTKLRLSGLGASFTRPTFNSINTSYSHIHKVSVLGLLGAIIGIEKESYVRGELPLFYKELKHLKIAIVPTKHLFYSKQLTTTDTTGFSNNGDTLVLNSEVLINPSWDIYILSDGSRAYDKIKDYLLNKNFHFIPYFGRNHLFANVTEVEILEGFFTKECDTISGLFRGEDITTEKSLDSEFNDEPDIYFQEYMPIGFQEKDFIQYEEDNLVITNRAVVKSNVDLLNCNGKNLYLI